VDSDLEVLARLRGGDERAFMELVEHYHTPLTRFAMSFGSRNDLAQDIVQETWLALLRGIDGFEGRSSLRTWLFQICANRARSMVVREHRVIPVDPADPAVDPDRFGPDGSWAQPLGRWSESVRERLDDAAMAERIRGAVAKLTDSQRQVVTLRDAQGMTSAQVCEILSITEANQRVLLHRGRARIRAILEEEEVARR
jgi:RNA polymerase sigma-70 factor, ECF subfamily